MLKSKSYGKSFITALIIFLAAAFLLFSLTSELKAEQGKEINFTILHTNDEHSALIPHFAGDSYSASDNQEGTDSKLGGFARLASQIKAIRARKEAQGEELLVLNAGDFIGGSIFSWLNTRGYAPELKILQQLEYDIAVIGNHEFDYGPELLADYLKEAGYPAAHDRTKILASNLEAPVDHVLSTDNLYQDTHIIELEAGLKIGFFSLIGKDAVDVIAEKGDMQFLDQHQTARNKVAELKEKDAELIIAITHSGVAEDRELAKQVEGIDIIVGGHDHTALFEPIIEANTIIVQADSYLKYLGQLNLAYYPDNQELKIINQEKNNEFLITLDDGVEADEEIAEVVSEYTAHLNELIAQMTRNNYQDIEEIISYSDFKLANQPPRSETPLGNFVTDAMRIITEQSTDKKVDIALIGSGNIRQPIVPDQEGGISFYNLANVVSLGEGYDGYPGYPIISVYFTGEEIAHLLEVAVLLEELMEPHYFLHFSGLRYDYNIDDAVLFKVPFLDIPIPTTRAVKNIEIFTGEGIQPLNDPEAYEALEKNEEKLYHLVTDAYVFSFLPLVEELLPHIEFEAKTEAGNPVSLADTADLTVAYQNRELKVWDTVINYAAIFGEDNAKIPDYYRDTSARINQIETRSYSDLIIIALSIIIVVLFALFIYIKKKK